jgi:hypothetical protein
MGENMLTGKLMFNPASFHSQRVCRLTGTADKLLLLVCLELCLHTHTRVCLHEMERTTKMLLKLNQ